MHIRDVMALFSHKTLNYLLIFFIVQVLYDLANAHNEKVFIAARPLHRIFVMEFLKVPYSLRR